MAGPTTAGYAALAEGEPWRYVGDTDQPAFENSWANAGTGLPMLAFRKREAGIVDIQGVIVSGATGAAAFTLPDGYRPSATSYLPATTFSLGGSDGAYLTVSTSGAVVPIFDSHGTIVIYAQVFLDPPAVA